MAKKPSKRSGKSGHRAKSPSQMPGGAWKDIFARTWKRTWQDNVGLVAAGVAYYGFLALVPLLGIIVLVYGLVADPATVAQQVESLSATLPQQAQPIVADQLGVLASGADGALGIGLVVSLLAALWSASSGTGNLMTAINIAYDEDEERGFLKLRAIALALTLGAIVFVLLTLALVAVVPVLLEALQLGVVGRIVAQVVRWTLLVGVVVVALAVIYRVAPNRDAPRFRWASPGAVVATVLWVLGSAGFSLYVNNFGSYNATYGALAGVAVLLLWLYLTSYVVLLGAEVNAESERQTERDTTRGEPVPMGRRRADAADTVPGQE